MPEGPLSRRSPRVSGPTSDQILEYLALPVLTVMAVALNFCMVLVTSRTAFSLPFKGLKAVMDTGEVLAAMAAQPRKGVST